MFYLRSVSEGQSIVFQLITFWQQNSDRVSSGGRPFALLLLWISNGSRTLWYCC